MTGNGSTPTPAETFGTDLGVMWEHGSIHMPKLARQYSALATQLHGTAAYDSGAFRRQGGDMVGPRNGWTQLRNTLQRILAETSRGLDSTGRALCQAAEHYAVTDSDAAAALEATKRDRFDTPGVDKPNPDVPPAPMPGDPQQDEQTNDRPVHGPT